MTKENKKTDKSKHSVFYWVILLVLVAIIIGAIWYIGFREPVEIEETSEEVVIQSDEVDTADWLTYENEEYGFSFKYPREWRIDKKNLREIVFLDISKEKEDELDDKFNKSIEDFGGTDSLSESDYHKLTLNINEESQDIEIDDWMKREYILNNQFYNEEKIELGDKYGFFVDNREWITHLIFAMRTSEDKVISLEKYINDDNENISIKIFKTLILSINN